MAWPSRDLLLADFMRDQHDRSAFKDAALHIASFSHQYTLNMQAMRTHFMDAAVSDIEQIPLTQIASFTAWARKQLRRAAPARG